MSTIAVPAEEKTAAAINDAVLRLSCYIAGNPVKSDNVLEVRSPYDNRLVGTVTLADAKDTDDAIEAGLKGGMKLNRYERYSVLEKTRGMLMSRKEEIAQLISAESGLAIREARYEMGRAHDVLMFAAIECLKDDGQIFSLLHSFHDQPLRQQ